MSFALLLVATVLVSRATGVDGSGRPATSSIDASISADGRFVAFESSPRTSSRGHERFPDIFVRDRQSGTTELVSVATGRRARRRRLLRRAVDLRRRPLRGVRLGADNLTRRRGRRHVRRLRARPADETTELVSRGERRDGTAATRTQTSPSISADGRFVAFQSVAGNLVAGDTTRVTDVFVRDLQSGTTAREPCATGGAHGELASARRSPPTAARRVPADADNLAADDATGPGRLRARPPASTTTLVSVASDGGRRLATRLPRSRPTAASWRSLGGRDSLVLRGRDGYPDIFVRDLQTTHHDRA